MAKRPNPIVKGVSDGLRRDALALSILVACLLGLWQLAAVTTPHILGLLATVAMIIPEPAPPRPAHLLWFHQ